MGVGTKVRAGAPCLGTVLALVTVTISACGPGKQGDGGSLTVPLPGHLAAGSVSTVTIPATVSAFRACDAKIYLAPGYGTTPQAPPVLVLLSGVPGDVSDWFDPSRIKQTVDDFAAKHAGRTLVVVTPDDTGVDDEDLLCMDGPLGNAVRYPALFPTFLDFSGEKQPMRDDRETAIGEVDASVLSGGHDWNLWTTAFRQSLPRPAQRMHLEAMR